MKETQPKGNYGYLILILAFVTIITIISTFLTYKNSKKAAEDSLKLQAIGIAVSLETSLKGNKKLFVDASRVKRNIFKEIITEGRWEGIAFIALYDKDGTTILHSNENLIGRKVQDMDIERVIKTGMPSHTYITLGTSERVFVLDFPAHVSDSERILRLALHTYPVEGLIRQARLHAVGMLLMIVVLWVMGYFFIKASRHSEELRAKMEERERFAIIGEMASVLAHEIRNPLGSIKGFAQYIIEGKGAGRTREYLDIIISESKRLEALTEDLLLYARPVEVRSGDVDVLELINEVVKSVQADMGLDIRVSASEGLKLRSDRDKLKQIFMNILHNSIDAESKVIDIRVLNKDRIVRIWISDDGCGMSEEVKENAFKPFFTTKAKGTGLGLAIVDKLVKAIGGKIDLKSRLQKGTVFKIEIPKDLI